MENKAQDTKKYIRVAIKSYDALRKAEAKYRGDFMHNRNEAIPNAARTSYEELARSVFKDPEQEKLEMEMRRRAAAGEETGKVKLLHPLVISQTKHKTKIGGAELSRKTLDYLETLQKDMHFDVLSVQSTLLRNSLVVTVLFRIYDKEPYMPGLFDFLGERDEKVIDTKSKLIIPEGALYTYTKEEIESHKKAREEQDALYKASDADAPFLNLIDRYEPKDLPTYDRSAELIYDLRAKESLIQTNLSPEKFQEVYVKLKKDIIDHEKYQYYEAMNDPDKKREFIRYVQSHIQNKYIATGVLPKEDYDIMMEKINKAFFEYDVLQDLIDDPEVTDIKVTDPYTIRVNIKGKFYLSNVTFIDEEDYDRFVQALAKKNRVNLRRSERTFTDNVHDPNYILRFSVTASFITSSGYAAIHIGKQPRKKLMRNDLIKAGMMDDKLADYLCDRARHGKGIVIAGPPRSGKTVLMNWLFEDGYEPECEILIIQENDELFAYRKGVTIEHVMLDPPDGFEKCTLNDLGEKALVKGCNVFIIGETKGEEIYHALTLANSGCRTAITVHAESAEETISRMVMLIMLRDNIRSVSQAKQMLNGFDTIVYVKGFQIQEITEIAGFDMAAQENILRPVYKRNYFS